MSASRALVAAVEALWRLSPPGPENLFGTSASRQLCAVCKDQYGIGNPSFALNTALRSLGLPCRNLTPRGWAQMSAFDAAQAIDHAFRRPTSIRRHLCPLDMSDDMPTLTFGTCRVHEFEPVKLAELFDAPRLFRHHPGAKLDVVRLAQFRWLIVEEEVQLDPRPEARASPFAFMTFDRDFGEIDPHLGRFPPIIEEALFFLLLATWEDWTSMHEFDWRAFRVPWIYTIDDNLLVHPAPPPSADSLSLELYFIAEDDGGEIELERPIIQFLDLNAEGEIVRWNDAMWHELVAARKTELFETPVAHFLVRAFLADGMDEVMAHLTSIEAALGLEMDHKKHLRPKPDPYPAVRTATQRMATRIAALLGDELAGENYKELFELRSEYVHGRAGLRKVSTAQRVIARSLAGRVARRLFEVARNDPRPRVEVLTDLLGAGTVRHETRRDG